MKEEQCAAEILEAVPLIMRHIRAEMRSHRGAGLSVPQFRVLTFLMRNPGASLSDLADHHGLTLPSMSVMVEGLVKRGLVLRQSSSADRRRVLLTLSARGRVLLSRARRATRARLAEHLQGLSPARCAQIADSLRDLHSLFAPLQASPGR
jgi:DNA-binding MarR family transcriptional regulator